MSASIDTALSERVRSIIAEIDATERARKPIEEEVALAVAGLDALAARAATSPSAWLAENPTFSPKLFNDSLIAILALVAPEAVRQIVVKRARHIAELWTGLRLGESEQRKRLDKLQAQLREARARLEVQRREHEARTGDTLPRLAPIDDPAVWLLPDGPLSQLAANGRTPR